MLHRTKTVHNERVGLGVCPGVHGPNLRSSQARARNRLRPVMHTGFYCKCYKLAVTSLSRPIRFTRLGLNP